MSKIEVLVVDDSALVRSVLTAIINAQPDMLCVGTASDPLLAREMIRSLNPDVITLDVEMPRMDGLDFLERLMRLRPMPVVMISTLTERGAETTMRALELGAVDFVTKPRIGVGGGLEEAGREIAGKIRIAARARVSRPGGVPAGERPAGATVTRREVEAAPIGHTRIGTERVIAIGASTGGTEAIRAVLARLPADSPAIVITQHMPPGFTRNFAQRLDSICRLSVCEAPDAARLLPGHVYIAPGGQHLRIERSGSTYVTRLSSAEPVNRHRPSVEVLFDSIARAAGPNAIGVMLTGMGRDGADAMRRMRDAGAFNLAQDEQSCVVFGMPREAIQAGAVDEVLPLDRIAGAIVDHLRHGTHAVARV